MDRHNKNDMHMKDTQNTEAQEEACAEAEAGDAGSAVQALPENLESLCREHVCPNCTEKRDAEDARLRAAGTDPLCGGKGHERPSAHAGQP